MTHLEVVGENIPCTADLPVVATEIPLGTEFTPGEAYKIVVNGQVTNAFTARTDETSNWVVKASPIENAEILVLESAPPQYQLAVTSRLPMGSSCSSFNGYNVSRPFTNHISVEVSHLEVDEENVPCTRDLPVVATNIPLGSDFASGQEYTVTVGDAEELSFTAQ